MSSTVPSNVILSVSVVELRSSYAVGIGICFLVIKNDTITNNYHYRPQDTKRLHRLILTSFEFRFRLLRLGMTADEMSIMYLQMNPNSKLKIFL